MVANGGSTVHVGCISNQGANSGITVSGSGTSLVAGKVVNGGTGDYGISVSDGASFTVTQETATYGSSGAVLDLAGLAAGAQRSITVYVQNLSDSTYRTCAVPVGANETTATLRDNYLVSGGTYYVWTSEDPATGIYDANSNHVIYLARELGDGSFINNGTLNVTDSTFAAAAVTNSGTFTVAGTSELHIGDLSGTIETDSEALTTLNIRSLDGTIRTANGAKLTGSRITGGGTNGGTITALGNLKFLPTSVLKNITLNATARP